MKYRKKPVVIDAILWDGTTSTILELNDENGFGMEPGVVTADNKIEIKTLEGIMVADVGDFIIKGVQGEFYPCKPDIFTKTYERIGECQVID